MSPSSFSRRALLGAAASAAALPALGQSAATSTDSASASTDSASALSGVTAIRRTRIPRTGELVPCIGLGTSRTFDEDPAAPPAALVEVMQGFLDFGGALIDSSPMYKRAEEMVGALMRAVGRSDAFYATKVWTDEGKQAGIDQMTASEALMGTPRFDLMQVHNLVGLDVQLATLGEWKASGRVRYVGITEMRDFAKVEELVASGAIDFVQVPYNVLERTVEARVLPACRDHGVGVLVMRPYGRGALFDVTRGRELPGWAADFGAASWGQLFLKFILGHVHEPIPIPATSKPHHLVDNMAAGVGPALDAAHRDKLVALLEG